MYHLRFLLLLFLAALVRVAPAQVTLRNLVSINIKPQDPYVDRMTRFGMSRAFHLFYDDIADANSAACTNSAFSFPQRIRWNPSRNGNRFINYDELYAQMPQRTIAVLHGSAPFMSGGLFGKPLCANVFGDPSNHNKASSYLINSIRASLFAAHYGSAPATGFPNGFEQIAGRYVEPPDNQVGNGNGTVRFVEVFNEADNAWVDGLATNNTDLYYPNLATQAYFSPDQYAAMLSAAYDGNNDDSDFQIRDANNNPVPNAYWGIKNLSPGTQVVMAGTADLRKDWIERVVEECNSLRGTAPLPFDVVNYHFYSTLSHPAIGTTDWNYFYSGKKYPDIFQGQFPEASNVELKKRFAKVLNEQHTALKTLPTWVTECGYSAAGSSFGAFDAATVQGQWLTRYILETSAVRDASGRGIGRLFIYELNDDLTTPGFTFHGLQKPDGTPKKAWYHVMTMLSIIGDRTYNRNNAGAGVGAPPIEQYFQNSVPNTPMAADDPRIYLYGGAANGAGGIYALWVPSGADVRYPGRLRLTGNWTAKPQIQKIEVLEYDEDGKRTMIPPADIVFTQGNPSVVWVNNLTLTETPQYLRVVNNAYSDPVVPPVLNLAASCRGCQRTQLTWTNPVNSHYAFFRVYYAKTSEYGDPANFNLSNMHLYGDQLNGNATSIYVDLPVDEYFFWVIPFRNPFDISSLRRVTVSPDLQGTLTPANSYYVKFKASDCNATPCVASLTQANITNLTITKPNGTVMNMFGNSYYQNGFYEALIPTTLTTICGEVNGTVAPPGPGIALAPNDPNTGMRVSFVVNFPTTQYLEAIQMYLQGGRAQVSIEFMEDCCSAYYLVKRYEFGGITPQWVTLNNSAPNKRIEKVRITIQAAEIAGAGVTINRLLFCTSPAPDRCRPNESSQVMAVTSVSDLQVTNIDSRSATLSFWPAISTIAANEAEGEEPVYLHKVLYGIALNAQGEIVQPQEVNVHGGGYGAGIEKSLSKLAPNTTYIVDVLPSVACADSPQKARVTFTTSSEEQKDRSTSALVEEIRLFPNPVADVLHLDVPAGQYRSWRILSINGTLLRSGSLSITDTSINVTVRDLPPGIHVVALLGTDGKPWSKGFLKAE